MSQKHPQNVLNYYFIGIGGIGMSALARYFLKNKNNVGGYDKVSTKLTENLKNEGCWLHHIDDIREVPEIFLDKKHTVVVYTPAVSNLNNELAYFREKGYRVLKRSEVLGDVTQFSKGLCVAGTHGKTTTSTLLAHILNQSTWKCNAFLGGISTNYNSNYIYDNQSEYTVIEADEYDRSFLKLKPYCSIITSVDPDHLDIYSGENDFFNGFQEYVELIDKSGVCVVKYGIGLNSSSRMVSYSIENKLADYYGYDLHVVDSKFYMKVLMPNKKVEILEIGLPGIHNAENALSCVALLSELGMEFERIAYGIRTFLGVKRRFEYIIRSSSVVYIDDYAHHPSELNVLIDSIKLIYPNWKIYMIFQPHLYSRTRDFMGFFANQLSRVDDLTLLPIYPAREEAIPGINSNALLDQINIDDKRILPLENVVEFFDDIDKGVVLTVGAGDINLLVSTLKNVLLKNSSTL